jgi:hypothetical protein
MAYRVTTEPVNRARPAIVRAHSSRAPRAPDTFSRNVTIATAALGCVCLIAAGVAVLGRDHSAGSLPDYVASHKALKIAWAEPEQQAQFERNPMLAATAPSAATRPVAEAAGSLTGPKADTPIQTASRFDAAFGSLGDNAPAITPSQVPIPHARPHKRIVAAIPLPRERVAEAGPAAVPPDQIAEPAPVAAAALDAPATVEPSPAPDAKTDTAERAMTLMSYAPPTSEQLFAPEVTGSIGNPLRDLGNGPGEKPAHAVVPPVKPPAVKPLSKVMPTIEPGPVKPAKPLHKLTLREKLWGPVQVASLGPIDGLGRDSNGIPKAPYDRQTAVYVITDKRVYMPDGSVLEAHSGLGDKMDDPRFAHVRMRGVTPPHVYDLKLRESLFHGVEAIRMLPIGGEEAIFGRDGILAHTYMLGPNGQSNGCVSFKDYDAFLEAFKDGKINRLAVIARLD